MSANRALIVVDVQNDFCEGRYGAAVTTRDWHVDPGGFVVETGGQRRGCPGQPARLYRRGDAKLVMPPLMRPGTWH